MHGSAEALKEWLERLAELMDDQSAAAKEIRTLVRRRAAQAESAGGSDWYAGIADGALSSRWRHAAADGGALFRLRANAWAKRRVARDARDAALATIEADLIAALESTLTFTAAEVSAAMAAELGEGGDTGAGPWIANQRDPRDARVARERVAADAVRAWLGRCDELAMALDNASRGASMVGEVGLRTTLASAALGIPEAEVALALLTGADTASIVAAARAELQVARRYCINREALDVLAPTDVASLMPEASAKVRLRRAELRGLL